MNKIISEKNNYMGKVKNMKAKNNKLNSKWITSSSTYNDYINFAKNWNYNLNKIKYKNKLKLSNINNTNTHTMIKFQERSKSHIKQSYNLYKEKINSFFNNKTIIDPKKLLITTKGKNSSTQAKIISYNNAGINNNNLYNNLNKIERSKKRNFTAKIIKSSPKKLYNITILIVVLYLILLSS